jgi:hypothetical protein
MSASVVGAAVGAAVGPPPHAPISNAKVAIRAGIRILVMSVFLPPPPFEQRRVFPPVRYA